MSIHGLKSKPFFVLAPMDDVTDTVFRQMVAGCAAPDLFFTEFVNVDGLMSPGRPNLLKKLRFVEQEGKVIAQLWGLKPENFHAVAQQIANGVIQKELGLPSCPVHHSSSQNSFSLREAEQAVFKYGAVSIADEKVVLAEKLNRVSGSARKQVERCVCGFAGVDLNMGCPAKSEVKNGACAALIQRQNWPLAHEIIEATREGLAGCLPLSVKTRVGFSAVDMEWFDFLLGHDLDMLSVHGRTRKQMSKVPADWDLIGQVRQKRDDLGVKTLIVGNGDVQSREHGERLASEHKLDGIMVGRGIFTNPYFFSKESSLTWEKCAEKERVDLFRRHVALFAATWQHGERPIHTLNKFCKVYIQNFDGAKDMREKLMATDNIDDLLALLNEIKL